MAKIDDILKTKFQNDKHRFIANLIHTSNTFQNLFVTFLKPFDLSPQQFNILRILRGANDWVTMNKIKELMIDKAPNATRLSDKLLDKGLIERKRGDEDRRAVYLNITEKGLELLKDIDENDVGEHEHINYFKRISEEDARYFSDVLDKMRG